MGVIADIPIGTDPFAPLTTIANGKTTLNPANLPGSGRPYGSTLAEFNRLRRDLGAEFVREKSAPWLRAVSGPWPVTALKDRLAYPAGFYRNIAFYFGDTGHEESVAAVCAVLDSWDADAWATSSSGHTFSEMNCQIKVGGNVPLHLTGIFYFLMYSQTGDPSGNATSTMPGINFVMSNASGFAGDRRRALYARVDAMVDPGTYDFHALVDAPGTIYPIYPLMFAVSDQFVDGAGNMQPPGGTFDARATFSGGVPTSGIHATKNVLRINFDDDPTNPIGVFGKLPVRFETTKTEWRGSALTLQATTRGFFAAKTPPVNAIVGDIAGLMPWNVLKASATPIFRNPPFEKDFTPERWKPGTSYAGGVQRLDSNGNLQQCIVSTGSGNSSGAEPAWSQQLEGVTIDGPLQWQMKHALHLKQAIAGMFKVPRWPHFWNEDPIAGLKTPSMAFAATASPSAVGWWIYRVYLNRIPPPNAAGITAYASPATVPAAIPVTLGCIRNGVFVPFVTADVGLGPDNFGHWTTGRTVEAMWPILTDSPLVYSATERVDVQASIITNVAIPPDVEGQAPGGFDGNLAYPLAAAHYNDVESVLALIP